jgi:hypothetical protein
LLIIEFPDIMLELFAGFLALCVIFAALIEDIEPVDFEPEDMVPDDIEPEPMLF